MNLLCCCLCCTMAPSTRVTRKWELFPGRNKFYCDGLLMSAPHTGVFYLTCFLITGTTSLFFAFDCPYLATRITPAIPIIGAVLYFFTMSALLRTTFTDPGVIPRASHDEAAYIEKQIEVPNSLNSPTYRPPPRTKEVLVKGQTVKLKYCFTCKIFRPPRASHCSLCDNCVDRFDHHCPWVGNCVGKRNYRFFYMFLVSLAFLAVFIFSCSVTHLVLLMKLEQEVLTVIKKAPFSVVVTFICFFSIWSVIGLAGFHTYLTTSDQTTNEDLKGSFSSKGGQRAMNPYSRGNICLNCIHILCGPMQPSLIDRRGVVTDEYILQMQHNSQNPNQISTEIGAVPSPLITSQPSLVGEPTMTGGRQITYDDNNPGIYRHRSYDNLQNNGNSNSLARLVDNEIPLSTTITTTQHQQEQCHQKKHFQKHQNDNLSGVLINNSDNTSLTVSPIITTDDDNVENHILLNRQQCVNNNLSDSYNNLFRDNIDNILLYNNREKGDNISCSDFKMINDTTTRATTASSSINDVILGKNLSTSIKNLHNTKTPVINMPLATSLINSGNIGVVGSVSIGGITAIAARAALCHSINKIHDFSPHISGIYNLRKSASESENVYSNIPNSNISSSVVSSNGSNKSDPNLHVYSNLIEEDQQQQQKFEKHKFQLQHNLANINKPLSVSLNKIHKISDDNSITTTATTVIEKFIEGNDNNFDDNLSKGNDNIHDDFKINDKHKNNSSIISTLLTDDLDLDDPVSAFIVNNRKNFETSSKCKLRINSEKQNQQQQQNQEKLNNREHRHPHNEKNSILLSSSSKSVTLPKLLSSSLLSNEVKPNAVIDLSSSSTQSTPVVGTTNNEQKITTASINLTTLSSSSLLTNNNHSLSSTSTSNKNSNNKEREQHEKDTSVSFITPSRLRLLQDTTMINTALDLDSLDDSSIGNNSQSCLVKTAMV